MKCHVLLSMAILPCLSSCFTTLIWGAALDKRGGKVGHDELTVTGVQVTDAGSPTTPNSLRVWARAKSGSGNRRFEFRFEEGHPHAATVLAGPASSSAMITMDQIDRSVGQATMAISGVIESPVHALASPPSGVRPDALLESDFDLRLDNQDWVHILDPAEPAGRRVVAVTWLSGLDLVEDHEVVRRALGDASRPPDWQTLQRFSLLLRTNRPQAPLWLAVRADVLWITRWCRVHREGEGLSWTHESRWQAWSNEPTHDATPAGAIRPLVPIEVVVSRFEPRNRTVPVIGAALMTPVTAVVNVTLILTVLWLLVVLDSDS